MNAIDVPTEYLMPCDISLEAQVLACSIIEARRAGANPLIRGLSPEAFEAMRAFCLPGLRMENGEAEASSLDEFDELLALFLDFAEPFDETSRWLAAALASAAQRPNHLWQDLGLPSRGVLSAIMDRRFPGLAALNSGDMKWKKFLYRQLCERAGVPICKSPHCAVCVDKPLCFGAEV